MAEERLKYVGAKVCVHATRSYQNPNCDNHVIIKYMYTFPSLAMYSALGFGSIRARIAEKNARKVEQMIASSLFVRSSKMGWLQGGVSPR